MLLLQNMKLLKGVLFVSLVVSLLFSTKVFAADTGQVAATVTIQNISLTVSDGIIAYGILAVSTTKSTIALADTQTITNNGNVNQKLSVRGTDSAAWSLESSIGTDQYVHKFCAATCSTPPTNYTPLTDVSYTTLAASVAPAGQQTLDLEISTPSTSTVFTAQSVNVSVQASLPG